MCKRSEQDPGWCVSHHADFLAAAPSCEAILAARPLAPEVRSPFVRLAMDRAGRRLLTAALPPKVLA